MYNSSNHDSLFLTFHYRYNIQGQCHKVKDDQLHSLKKSVFCLKTSYFKINKTPPPPPRRQLCQWSRLAHNCLQSASILGGFPFLISKLTDVPIWSLILSSNLITIVIDRTWFCNTFSA